MSTIAIIPARGGSKRILRKNMVLCGGRPLLAHTFEAAKASHRLDRIVLSTDDPEIADFGRSSGIEVPYMRPPQLAADDTPMIAVLQNLLEWLDRDVSSPAAALVLLQPTSPLRTAAHIDAAVDLFSAKPNIDSVVSVVAPPHIYHPLKSWKILNGVLVPYLDNVKPIVGSRDLPPAWARNGPAILVMRPALVRSGELYGKRSLPYVMERDVSIDVDEPFDLAIADFLLRRRGSVKSH